MLYSTNRIIYESDWGRIYTVFYVDLIHFFFFLQFLHDEP